MTTEPTPLVTVLPPVFMPCRRGCAWYMGFRHDHDCPGTRGRARMTTHPTPGDSPCKP